MKDGRRGKNVSSCSLVFPFQTALGVLVPECWCLFGNLLGSVLPVKLLQRRQLWSVRVVLTAQLSRLMEAGLLLDLVFLLIVSCA